MIDPDLEKYLTLINNSVKQLKISPWRALGNGILNGFGYVIGFGLALAVIGYSLNVIGVIPAFKNQVDEWRGLLERTQDKSVSPLPQNTR